MMAWAGLPMRYFEVCRVIGENRLRLAIDETNKAFALSEDASGGEREILACISASNPDYAFLVPNTARYR